MQPSDLSHPLKVTSRSLPQTRTNRLRFSWFLLGAGCGVGCSLALSLGLTPSLMNTAAVPAAVAVVAEAPAPVEAQTKPVELIMASGEKPAEAAHITSPVASNTAYPLKLTLTVKNGDTLSDLLADAGISKDEAYAVVETVRKKFDPKKLDVGQSIIVSLDKAKDAPTPILTSMVLPMSNTASLEVSRKGEDFDIKQIDKPLERKLSRAGGRINSSLYETATANGLPAGMIGDIIQAYSYDVDFQRDIQPGDSIDVLFERMQTREGLSAGYGNMLYAELNLGNKVMKVYRYVDATGRADYYNEKGESVRKALLKTPINGARITSGYGVRNHPILGYSKMHRGIDFGAPAGTPIYAAGDGTVDFAARKGGYGNYLKIKHNGTYASAYAHLSRFAAGVKPGSKVKQGQVVAYVGSTGQSTGPHLHYEILVNNQQVNPSGVKFKTGTILKGKELASFKKTMETLQAQLESTPRSQKVAMAEKPAKSRVN